MEPKKQVNAKKNVHQRDDALRLISESTELFVAKGKKVVHLNLKKEDWTEGEVLKLVLGPTGNLRAPTMRSGKKLIVGFNEEMFEKVFGG